MRERERRGTRTSLLSNQSPQNYVDEEGVERIEEHMAEDNPALDMEGEDSHVVVDSPVEGIPVEDSLVVVDNPAADIPPSRIPPADNL